MKRKILISLFLIFNIIAEKQHPELINYQTIKRECPDCERIYVLRDQLNYINQYKIKSLDAINNWISIQPITKVTKDLQSFLKDIQQYSDLLVTHLPHDPKVNSYLDSIAKLVKQIDFYLPEHLKLEKQNFYERMKKLSEVDLELRNKEVPDMYFKWLEYRTVLKPMK